MQECIFCKIVQGEIPDCRIWENEKFIAFLDIRPIELGHTLIIPKKHIDSVFDLPTKDYCDLFSVARELEMPIRKATGSKRVGLVIEGFGVPHAHLHLVPINEGNELDPHRAHEVADSELVAIQEKLKNLL